MKKNTDKARWKSYYLADAVMARLFFLLLIVVAVLALIPVLRPDYSETEKRELARFPKFSLSAVVSGEYFDDINLWYADTFPGRDSLVSLNNLFKGSFGVSNSVEIYGDVGVGDDIPDAEATTSEEASADTSSVTDTSSAESTDSKTAVTESGSKAQVSSSAVSSAASSSASSVASKPKAEPATETLGAVLRVKNAAYEYYNFKEDVAKAYASHINYAAKILDGKATVYDIIAPTSIAITLDDETKKEVKSYDQKKAIDYMYGRMSDKVVKVNAYDTLREHRNEYLYFRTDHHWTALGAYYSYCELMKAKGTTPPTLDMFTKREFKGFLGSFYTNTKSAQLKKTPDTVVAYEPKAVNIIKTTLDKKTIMDKKIVSDGNALSASNKYLCFISGDRPYGIINNPQITDGSSCLVIKESYGNAMVPFFTANYQTVHVIDYRHFPTVDSRKLLKFVEDNKIQDVVFVNNISATRNKALVEQIGSFVREEEKG